jgi:hypothetical protein
MSPHLAVLPRPSAVAAFAAVLLALLLPVSASAHAELQSSDPASGAVVPSPFSGPISLTFTESLAVGSKGDLYGPGHQLVASATTDAGTMTISPAAPLAPGQYTVEWVSIADDGDLLRGTVTFSVAAAASPSVEATASAAPSAGPSAVTPSATGATASAEAGSPSPSPAPTGDTGGAGTDVILPIVIVLIAAAAGAFYLVRRNRPG